MFEGGFFTIGLLCPLDCIGTEHKFALDLATNSAAWKFQIGVKLVLE